MAVATKKSKPRGARKSAGTSPSRSSSASERSAPAPVPRAGGPLSLRLPAPRAAIQAKVKLGEVDDPYEREADTVASRVTEGSSVAEISTLPAEGLAGMPSFAAPRAAAAPAQAVQRQAGDEEEPVQMQTGDEEEPVQMQAGDEEEPVQMQAGDEEEPVQMQTGDEEEPVQMQAGDEEEPVQMQAGDEEEPVQMQAGDEEEPVQMQAGDEEEPVQASVAPTSNASRSAPSRAPAAEQAIHHSGPGSRIQPPTRRRLESGLGLDLAAVRVHDDETSHRANRDLGARAFTHGSHIWLGRGESQNDLSLMAHETTHVLQQDAVVRRQPLDGPPPPGTATGTASPPPAPPSGAPASPTAATGAGASTAPTAEPAAVGTESAPASETPPAAAGAAPTAGAPAAAAGGAAVQPAPEEGGDEASAPSGAATATAGGGGAAEGGAAGGGGAAPSPAGAAGGEGGAVDDGVLMPEPPEELSAEERARIEAVEGNAEDAGAATTDLPAAEESTSEARAAVDEPATETAARAQNALVDALGERPAPSPEIEELCERIRRVIREKRPPDEESLVRADPEEMASEAGSELNESVEGDVDRVGSEYDELQEPPEGTPQQEGQEMEPPPASAETPDLEATSANPDGVSEEEVDLTADVEANQARMDEAGMTTEVAEVIESGPVAEARGAMGELEETAARDPAEVLAEQRAILADSQTAMAQLQAQAVEALAGSRSETVSDSTAQQTGMVGSETDMREQASRRAEEIFTSAQQRVDTLLQPLTQTAMDRWEAGVEVLSTEFKQHLDRVEDWIEERHSGGWGAVVSVWDELTGLPGWVTEEYDRAERTFGDGVCDLIREISTEVNGVIAACEAIIEDARTRISEVFASLPAELQEWAASEQASFGERLDGLQQRVTQTQQDFTTQLVEAASSSVQQVREQVHALREAAKGLIGRIADAVSEFLDDPVRAIINGLLDLVGIPPPAFWALVERIGQVISDIADDPLGFANNLVTALGEGFQLFFDNIGDHLLQGLLDWLFSGLGAVGVQIPTDFSLKGIITFFLQLMGITWPRVRALLAEEIGEENVALIEKAYELVANLIELGPEGLFEMLKEQLSPQSILDQVLQAAIDFLVEALITQVTARIIALFNPAGAIVQAIELIYRVLSWVFNNAARIFRLVETVVNGAADLVAGNTSGLAAAIETALAGMLPAVIDFLAGYIGLGDLPEKIADVIRGFQQWVEGILRRIIKWLADRGRALLSALGLGGESEDDVDEDDPEKAEQVRVGLAAIDTEEQRVVEGGKLSHEEAENVAATVRQAHPVFTSLVVVDGGDSWDYHWEASPGGTKETPAQKEEDAAGVPDDVQAILGEPMGTPLPAAYYYRTQNDREFPVRRDANDETYPQIGLDKDNKIKLGASEDVEQHPSQFVMEGKQNGKWMLKDNYRGSFKIRTRFYYSNRSYPDAVIQRANQIINANEDPNNSANWIHPSLTGGESVPKSDFTIEHSPPVASHWTNMGGNSDTQQPRVSWFSFEGRASEAVPLSRSENSRRGSGGVEFTPEVTSSFRGPGD